MDTFQFFASRAHPQPSEANIPKCRPGYRGIKGDDELIAEIAQRLGDRPHRIAPVLEVAAAVLAEWQANGWWPDPLDPICGALGESQIG